MILKILKYLFFTPFNPKKGFESFKAEADSKRKKLSGLIFSMVVLICTVIYWISTFQVDDSIMIVFLSSLGFIIGLAGKNLLIAYLLYLGIKKFNLGLVRLNEPFQVVALAMLPFLIITIWYWVDYDTSRIGSVIIAMWNATLLALGLKYLYGIKIVQSLLIIILTNIIIYLVQIAFFGIRLGAA